MSGDKGEPLLVTGRILSTSGEPIPNAVIDTWEADADGLYDVQYNNYNKPDHRGRLRSNDKGEYTFRLVAVQGPTLFLGRPRLKRGFIVQLHCSDFVRDPGRWTCWGASHKIAAPSLPPGSLAY